MKRETTPVKITDKVMELCSGIVPDAGPGYVPVEVQGWALPGECFPNVGRMVRERGGQQVNGWVIWQWANILVEAEAHSVWRSPEGKLADITPHDNGEKEILFLKDDDMAYRGNIIANIGETPGKEHLIPQPLWARIEEIKAMLHEEVKGNEFCPCQSGLKYKKCCGRGW